MDAPTTQAPAPMAPTPEAETMPADALFPGEELPPGAPSDALLPPGDALSPEVGTAPPAPEGLEWSTTPVVEATLSPSKATSKGLPPMLAAAARTPLLKAICYAPVPLKGHEARLLDDDFMDEGAAPLWSADSGRGDLLVMKQLGANAVRLYGNDPELQHGAFLDEAAAQGLEVIAGLSDYPYMQMKGSCAETEFDCYEQIKASYLLNLKGGFLKDNTSYHPALRTVVLINEPELVLQPAFIPAVFCKAIVSAFDAVLDAERQAAVAASSRVAVSG